MKTVRLLFLSLAFSFLLQGWSFAQTADLPSGSGTSEDPYLIATLNNLYWVTQNSSSWDKYFKQTADIDAATTSTWDGGAGFLPIGTTAAPFTGSYNGQGGSITSLTIDRSSTSFMGMFGFVAGGEIENLGINADMTGSGHVGAIVGCATFSSSVSNCISTGTVSGDYYVGGLVGSLEESSLIDKCASLANVSAERYVGGLVGRNLATITECYASGSVNGTVSDEGGLVGGNTSEPTVSNSFWDTETSTLAASAGGTGKTTTEMKTLATYTSTTTSGLATAWDFIGTPNDDAGILDWWNMDATYNSGYPVPSWDAFPIQATGDGTSEEPYQISTLNNLYWLTQTSAAWAADKNIEQTADIAAYSTAYIDFGQGFKPIGNSNTSYRFYGSYNGQGHEIAGLFINRSTEDDIGLFGFINGTVSALHLREVDIFGHYDTGGLAGWLSNGTLRWCSCTGNVSADQYVGLLVGYVYYRDTIEECWTEGTVSGNNKYVGGLIGVCRDAPDAVELKMSDCYSRANVSGDSEVGGLIGHLGKGENTGLIIEHCYSTGTVTGNSRIGGFFGYENSDFTLVTLSGNFWDTESSGLDDGVGNLDPDPDEITGKTTALMKTESTFTGAGWDFVGETTNGTDNIWDIDGTGVTNNGYPYLSYQPTDITWNGSVGTSWVDANNWSGSKDVPTSVKNIIIPDVANNPVIASAVEVAGLTIQSGGKLTIAPTGSLTVNGMLTNNAGNSGLIIQSTAAGTGSLISGSASVPATVQRYIDGSSAWHLVSSPVSEATAETFTGHYMQFFTEATADWTDIVEPSTSLNPAQGYTLWSGEETYSYQGNLNSGNVSIATTQQYEDPVEHEFYGWNLLGNPYPSSIDWAQLDDTWGAVYYYTGSTYATWNNDAQTNGGTRYLAPGQGFFISSDGNDFQLTDANRTHEGASGYFKSKTAGSDMLLLKLTSDQGSDEACIRFSPDATDSFDREFDAWKILTGDESTGQLYTFSGNGILSIDTRPACNEVQLGFRCTQSGMFSFSLPEIHDFTSAVIEDTKTSKRHDLQDAPYTFQWEAGDAETRFKLHLNSLGINETSAPDNGIYIYTSGHSLCVSAEAGSNVRGTDIAGRLVWEEILGGTGLNTFPLNLKTGVYMVTVAGDNTMKTEKVIWR